MSWALLQGDVDGTLSQFPPDFFHGVLCDPPYGYQFMGKKWDYDVPAISDWEAINRTMRPGAAMLSFGGSRTFHRITCGIEDAGLEIRDVLTWLYAKGFPKSLQLHLPEGLHGTALKPAWEPIVLARKPLESTVQGNLETWGTGCLAIDATRPNGRWPANLVLDEEAGELLDATVGDRPSRKSVTRNGGGNQGGAVFTERTGQAKPDTGFEETGGRPAFSSPPRSPSRNGRPGARAYPSSPPGRSRSARTARRAWGTHAPGPVARTGPGTTIQP